MNTFYNAVKTANNTRPARTTNGMAALSTSSSAVLDFFTEVGSARGKDMSAKFFAALSEDEDLALRALAWVRDIRGGAGERKQFRDLVAALEAVNPAQAARVMPIVPELGRWDDLFAYQEHFNRVRAFEMIRTALLNKNALAAKWMPRKGPLAVALTRFMGLSPREYRKLVVGLTQVVETSMCAKQWSEINFSHVPSMASARYQKAFGRNAQEQYSNYIRELQKPVGERNPTVKINAGAIYPHTVVRSVFQGNEAVADAQWAALPNYVGDARILPMVDVSGSMGSIGRAFTQEPQPIEVAVALGLYLSSKNTGPFRDTFLTFTAQPRFVQVQGTLSQRLKQMSTSAWQMTTNLHAAMDEILGVALRHRVPQSDMPEILLVLSDMQFNQCTRYDDQAIEMIRRKYEQAGYPVPRIVFWNLRSGHENVPVRFDELGTAHVSGFSPSIMTSVLANDLEDYTPYNVMLKTLLDPRYAPA
jgi:hypothetical protein